MRSETRRGPEYAQEVKRAQTRQAREIIQGAGLGEPLFHEAGDSGHATLILLCNFGQAMLTTFA